MENIRMTKKKECANETQKNEGWNRAKEKRKKKMNFQGNIEGNAEGKNSMI